MKSHRILIKFLIVLTLGLNLEVAPSEVFNGSNPIQLPSAQAQISTILRHALKFCIKNPTLVGGSCIGGYYTITDIYDRIYPQQMPPEPPPSCQEIFDGGTQQAELFCGAIESDTGFPTEQFENLADCIAKIRCEYWKANQTQCNDPSCAGLKNFLQACDCSAPPLNIPSSGFGGSDGDDDEDQETDGSNGGSVSGGGASEGDRRN